MSTPPDYHEPQLSVCVLDFNKPEATLTCLESVRRRIRVRHRTIYLHNGPSDYAYDLYENGLVDQFIQTRANNGLGIGTRDLIAACFSPYFLYLQNDQVVGRDFVQTELDAIIAVLVGGHTRGDVASVSLAGPVGGPGVYSERAHIMATATYKTMERSLPLTPGGAGPYHHQMWREEQIQRLYLEQGWTHHTSWPPLVIDNGREAVRQNPDGSIWRHEPDTKALVLVSGPVKERYVYPKLNDEEWTRVLTTQSWPPGSIPANEVKDSFKVGAWH